MNWELKKDRVESGVRVPSASVIRDLVVIAIIRPQVEKRAVAWDSALRPLWPWTAS